MASNNFASQLEQGMGPIPIASHTTTETPTTSTFTDEKTISSFKQHTSIISSLKTARISWPWKKKPRHRPLAKPKVRRLEDYPTGYPKLSCFLDSDDAFMVYRRFGSVFSRLLLNKQDEISGIEAKLLGMDKMDDTETNRQYLMSRALDVDRDGIPRAWREETRPQLLENLEKKTLEYAELLLKARELKAINPPSDRDYNSVLSFMENDDGQLYEKEMEYIYEKADLVTLRPGREHAWLDGMIENILKICRCGLLRFLFVSKESKAKTIDKDVHYYDRGRIAMCTTMIITIIILVLLIVPIWLLYRLSLKGAIATDPRTIGVIIVPTLIFSAVLSAVTKAKRHELLAASAGYCAVLVVFLGNVNNITPSSSHSPL
ncbi:hypothetical protein JMJ35_001063 [Cladonia borealis]|uniref:DUF6594 domain-containing protein n=1 Tax=Cladonia borealis TaxID=184061 RepID=A0AA39R7V8_9LECA|nr:hypothetical protein JMJ35_001063 [Cladonia borealis]